MRIAMSQIKGAAALNLIIQPLWDTVLLGTAQTGEVSLFTVPQGQNSKTLIDTNMVGNGILPAPNEFYLRGFLFQPVNRWAYTQLGSEITDMGRITEQTAFSFFIGTSGRKLIECLAHLLPAGIGLEGCVTTGGATTLNVQHIYGNGVRRLDNRFGLGDFAEVLNATEAFRGQLKFPAGTLSLSASQSVRLYLAGVMGQSVG